jgi:hypothetical protein
VVRDERTELVVSANDIDGSSDERSLAERDSEADAPAIGCDICYAEAAACVLLDAKEAVEGEQTRAPVPSVRED